jgi:hypothetical protein
MTGCNFGTRHPLWTSWHRDRTNWHPSGDKLAPAKCQVGTSIYIDTYTAHPYLHTNTPETRAERSKERGGKSGRGEDS